MNTFICPYNEFLIATKIWHFAMCLQQHWAVGTAAGTLLCPLPNAAHLTGDQSVGDTFNTASVPSKLLSYVLITMFSDLVVIYLCSVGTFSGSQDFPGS